eukprot:TRINITY_DN325_c0_g1_i4.p1 TRINITY_DN325_c0_g1~~TRINITY_DN325_c0_g1_i4.p1  ORF type:complete len:450 (+),score=40.29 TRINITY_DN325_c0_g1_i4:425-1774(+)
MMSSSSLLSSFSAETEGLGLDRTTGVNFLQVLEGISGNRESGATPSEIESKLAILEELDQQHKPWRHGFQQLLSFPLSMDEDSLLLHMANQHSTTHYLSTINPGDLENNSTVTAQHVQQQPIEPESCITHVSESCSHLKNDNENETEIGKEYLSSSEAPEEGITSTIYDSHNSSFALTSSPEASRAIGMGSGSPAQNRERRKRKRSKACKNSQEVESQRMTHIAVERNRRKQMNEHLAVLRTLMPGSYIQRGDQASIIGGAIDYVKELEQLLQSLEAQKRKKDSQAQGMNPTSTLTLTPFHGFFLSPQYTDFTQHKLQQRQHQQSSTCSSSSSSNTNTNTNTNAKDSNEVSAENKSAVADIEVSMIETHANIKILSEKRPAQLLRTIVALQALHLTILHLNITTIDHTVFYSFNVKIEEECQVTSTDEIAAAVHHIFDMIHSSTTAARR